MLIEDRIDVTSREITPEGFLVAKATLARTGIHVYTAAQVGDTSRMPTERVAVYRPADEVFRPESMKSFARKPVTDDHPPEGEAVTLDNAGLYQVGLSGDSIERNGDKLEGSITVTARKAIDSINRGRRQISLGYECDFVRESGVADGVPYDYVQRNIRGNHVALVDRGRCGPTCAIADGADCDGTCNHQGGDPMKTTKMKIGDSEVEVPEAVAKHIAKLTADMEEAEKKAEDMEEEKRKADEEAEKAKDEAEEAKEAKDKAEAARDAALAKAVKPEDVQRLVADHAAVLEQARRLHPKIESVGKSIAELRRATVVHLVGDEAVKDKSDAYIEARFDALCEGGGESARFARRNLQDAKAQDDRTESRKAHDAAVAAVENAWEKKPAA